jgi:RimJ/RimL family protein N-acetyltransferase
MILPASTKGKENKMFGNPMYVKVNDIGVSLRPFRKDEMSLLAEYFSSHEVSRFTNMVFAKTPEDELEWWEKVRKEPNEVIWGIVPDGSDHALGSTGLHGITSLSGSCTSGIIIGDRSYWGKGIAYSAHLARTLYAVNVLNRNTIQSTVRSENTASLKVLQKIGYIKGDGYIRDCFTDGRFFDTHTLTWLNPRRVSILYPEGVPEHLLPFIQKARETLDLAEKSVKFL